MRRNTFVANKLFVMKSVSFLFYLSLIFSQSISYVSAHSNRWVEECRSSDNMFSIQYLNNNVLCLHCDDNLVKNISIIVKNDLGEIVHRDHISTSLDRDFLILLPELQSGKFYYEISCPLGVWSCFVFYV